jgi:ATP-binding cassette subfamily B protein/subfamily B ATP-binding cassette protein MsbA
MKLWWMRLTPYALPYRRELSLLLLLLLAGVGLNVLKPWPLKLIVDYVLTDQPLPGAVAWLKALPGGESTNLLLSWLAGGTIALFLTSEAVRITQKYLEVGVGDRMAYDLGAALFDHLQHLSLRFHAQQRAGDLVRRATIDSGCVRVLVIKVFLTVFTSLVSLVAMFVVMWQIDRTLSLVALFAAPLIVVLIWVFNQPMAKRTYEHQQLEGEMMALSEQTLTALPVVQAFGREAHEDRRFMSCPDKRCGLTCRLFLPRCNSKLGLVR